MTGISPSDRLMAILRQKLRERVSTGSPGAAGHRPMAGAKPPTGLDALARLGDADSLQLRRACIQGLLSEQLGENLLNDAQFQQIVSRVTAIIGDDAAMSRLLDRVIRDLRSD